MGEDKIENERRGVRKNRSTSRRKHDSPAPCEACKKTYAEAFKQYALLRRKMASQVCGPDGPHLFDVPNREAQVHPRQIPLPEV